MPEMRDIWVGAVGAGNVRLFRCFRWKNDCTSPRLFLYKATCSFHCLRDDPIWYSSLG